MAKNTPLTSSTSPAHTHMLYVLVDMGETAWLQLAGHRAGLGWQKSLIDKNMKTSGAIMPK